MKKFYKLFLTSIVLLFAYTTSATVYFVSASGNDANSGTSASLPWRTMTKVNSFNPKAGDQILFNRGDEWIGTITVKSSGTAGNPIVYGAYGTGDKPKIYGSEVITGWTLHSGNIYKASFATDITQIFVDGTKVRLARLTNTGYNTVNSVTSQTQFSSDALNPGFDYSGARVMLKTSNYYSVMRTVTSSSSKTLTINSVPTGTIKINQGFLLMNKLEFLDSPGEWYYDTATNIVYLWTPNGDSPANYIVRGSTLNDGIFTIGTKNFITIRDLHIIQQTARGLNINGGNNTIDNNHIEGQEGFGIYISGNALTIQNNTINDCNGLGINAPISNSIIRDNWVTNIGVFDKLGLNGTWSDNGGSGMEISGNGNTIEYNRVIGTNYNGIFWRGNSILQYNFIKDACLSKSDGGGIYTGGTSTAGSTLRYNIIDNVVGNHQGGTTGRNMAEGIFFDEPSMNITCEYNTVVRCSNSGIMMFRNENHVVRHNTIMDARYGIFAAQFSGTVKSNITNNIIVTNSATNDYEARQVLVRYYGNALFDNNTYVCPFASDLVFKISDGTYRNFASWKTFISGDANSTFIGTKLGVGETQVIFYNDTKQIKTFYLGNSVYRDIYSKQLSGTFTLEPFTSKVLVKTTLITNVDNTDPIISSFIIPSNSATFTIPVSSFTATDNIAVTGFKLTETPTAPLAADAGWTIAAPTSYTFSTEGAKTLYAWAKDAAGNVSTSISAQVILPSTIGNIEVYSSSTTETNLRAMPVTFNEAATINSISVYHNGGTGNVLLAVFSDRSGSPSSRLGVTASTTINSTAGWQTISLTNPVAVASGQTVWLAWIFQNNPGLRWTSGTPGRASSPLTWSSGMPATFGTSSSAGYKFSIYCTYSPTTEDVTKPTITAFNIPETSSSLVVPISNFTASDNKAVTGFMLTESATAPLASAAGWSAGAPASYSFATEGTKTLYAWVKDAAGNVSTSLSDQVIITIPDVTKPVVTAFSIPANSSSLAVAISSFTASDNKAVTGFMLTESATAPLASAAGWSAGAPVSYSFATEGTKTLYAWAKDDAGNVSTSASRQVVITLPATITTLGYTEVYSSSTIEGNLRAMPVTFIEAAIINSISVYHNGGKGNVLLAVFSDQSGSPSSRLGVTASTTINSTAGWQTISLTSPVAVTSGQTVWLAWIFQNNPGLRWTSGTPGRASSPLTWSSGMPATFGTSSSAGYKFSIYCNYASGITTKNSGNTEVFSLTTTEANRRAMPLTFSEVATINSISVYHNGGSGNVLLAVFSDQSGSPSSRLGVTASTTINPTAGWQTISLTSPVSVTSGQKVWLAWVFQNNPGIRWTYGTPGRASSPLTWSSGMPATFGTSSSADYKYSIYCTYTANPVILKDAVIPKIIEIVPDQTLSTESDNQSVNDLFIEKSVLPEETNDFILYPNPAKSFINVDYSDMPELGTTIEIFDSNGRTLYKKQVESTSNRIEIGQFPVGLYFIRSISHQKYNVKKLIVK